MGAGSKPAESVTQGQQKLKFYRQEEKADSAQQMESSQQGDY